MGMATAEWIHTPALTQGLERVQRSHPHHPNGLPTPIISKSFTPALPHHSHQDSCRALSARAKKPPTPPTLPTHTCNLHTIYTSTPTPFTPALTQGLERACEEATQLLVSGGDEAVAMQLRVAVVQLLQEAACVSRVWEKGGR